MARRWVTDVIHLFVTFDRCGRNGSHSDVCGHRTRQDISSHVRTVQQKQNNVISYVNRYSLSIKGSWAKLLTWVLQFSSWYLYIYMNFVAIYWSIHTEFFLHNISMQKFQSLFGHSLNAENIIWIVINVTTPYNGYFLQLEILQFDP